MNYLLFIVYLIIICWFLMHMPVIRRLGIDPRMVLGLFLLKIMAGIAIGWVSIHIYGHGNDYWDINDEAWIEYQLLINDPALYFKNIFTSDYASGYGGMFGTMDSYWNDLKANILIKIVSVFNLFSRGDYYINSLFFNFIVFFGHVALYKLFIRIFANREKLIIIGCFLLPSTLYFSSGIHKDGLVFLLLSVMIYLIFDALQENKITLKRLLLVILILVLLFLIRHFIFIALVPALLAWIIAAKAKWRPVLVFPAVYLIFSLLLFNIDKVVKQVKPLDIIVAKQTEYLNLPVSNTEIELISLQPSALSFAKNTPEAFNHLLLRPYVWEMPVKSILPISIELVIYQILFLLFIFFHRKKTAGSSNTVLYFLIGFTLSVFLLTGYIVPNLGSIARYRSLYLPLIITPVLCMIAWEKIATILKIRK